MICANIFTTPYLFHFFIFFCVLHFRSQDQKNLKNNFLNTHFSFLRYLTHFTLFSHTFAFFYIFLINYQNQHISITHQQIFAVFEILHMLWTIIANTKFTIHRYLHHPNLRHLLVHHRHHQHLLGKLFGWLGLQFVPILFV